MNKVEKFIEQILPFLLLGIAIALVIGLIVVFSYVIIWGILLGAIIWLGFAIKNYFFPSSKMKKKGNIIEHDDKK